MTSYTITKPKSAFQHYLSEWKNLSPEAKKMFEDKAEEDFIRYNNAIKKQEEIEEEETKKLNIFLTAYTGGYSAVGLDNGARSYKTLGPMVKIIEYSEDEQKKWGVKVKEFRYYDSSFGGSKMSLYHNQKYHKYTQYGDPNTKGKNIYTYGKTYNFRKDNPYNPIPKFSVDKNALNAGNSTQHYTSFSNETWTTSSE